MKTQTLFTMLALAALTVLAGCSQSAESSPVESPILDSPIRIGWIGALTGPAALYGAPALAAAQIAVEDVNAAGGIDGRRVEIISEDGKCEGSTATIAAQKLIDVDRVKYILGGHCSTESLSIVPISEKNAVFLMAGATSTNLYSGAGRYTFRTTTPAFVVFGALAEFVHGQKIRQVATFSEEKDWPHSVIKSFSERFIMLGGEIVAKETFAPGTTDFRTALMKLREADPDALMISVQAPDSAAQIVRQLAELGWGVQIFGDSQVISEATYERSGGLLPATAIGASVHADADAPDVSALLERLEKKVALSLDAFFATEAYDGARIVAELIRKCGDDTDCAREAVLSTRWQGVTGEFVFDDKGDPTPHFSITRVENGAYVIENFSREVDSGNGAR